MIAYIRGVLAEKEPTRAVIEAAGVGYELFIPLSTYDRLPKTGSEVKLLAFHDVREDAEVLYGFATAPEREMFTKLTAVNGVGPKIAVAILSGSGISELSLAIASGNVKRISAIKGVGKKTAEKICLELRDKVNAFASQAADSAAPRPFISDAILALGALGFNEETANKMVAKVLAADSSVKDTETLVRLALSSK